MPFDTEIMYHAVQSVLTFFLIGCVGYFLARKGWFSDDSRKLISKLITEVALPVYLVYNVTTELSRDKLAHLAYGVVVPLVSVALNLALGMALARLLNLPANRRGIFSTAMGFSNTIFIGLPINLALFGDEALPYVLIYYFANASLFWTYGNYLLVSDGAAEKTPLFSLAMLKKIFPPPTVGFLLGMLLLLLNIPLPGYLANAAKHLGGMTTPLVILSIGVTLFSMGLAKIRFSRDLALIIFGRFVISPVIIMTLIHFFPLPDLMRKVFVIQASLPVMSNIAMLSSYYKSDSEYATVAVSATTLLSMLTVPIYMVIVSSM